MDKNLVLKIKKLMALANDKASKEESAGGSIYQGRGGSQLGTAQRKIG